MEKELSQTETRFLYKEPRWQTAKRIRYKFSEAKAFELFRILPLWEATVLLIVFSYDIIRIDNSFLVSGFRHYQPIQRLHRDMGHLVRCKANMWDSFRGCEAYSAGSLCPAPVYTYAYGWDDKETPWLTVSQSPQASTLCSVYVWGWFRVHWEKATCN